MAPQVHAQVAADAPADRIILTGSHKALGAWDPESGIKLEWRDNAWVTQEPISLPAGIRVECKFVRVSERGGLEWETGPNRVLSIPTTDSSDLKLCGKFNGQGVVSVDTGSIEAKVKAKRAAALLQEQLAKLDTECKLHKTRHSERTDMISQLQKEISAAKQDADRLAIEERTVIEQMQRQVTDVQREADKRVAAALAAAHRSCHSWRSSVDSGADLILKDLPLLGGPSGIYGNDSRDTTPTLSQHRLGQSALVRSSGKWKSRGVLPHQRPQATSKQARMSAPMSSGLASMPRPLRADS